MKRFLATVSATTLLLGAAPAFAQAPGATPTPLPIRGVTVEVKEGASAPGADAHIERPPLLRAAPAAPRAKSMAPAVAPTPTPTPSPTPRR